MTKANLKEIKNLAGSQIEISAEIAADVFDSYRKKALDHLRKEIKMDGFRPGNVPDEIIVAKAGEKMILEEMAEIALAESYSGIVTEAKIEPIGRPEISITKLAIGNPLTFKIKVAVYPDIELPEYKKIASEVMSQTKEEIAVEESEVAEVIEELKKMGARFKEPADLREKVRENLLLEKKIKARDRLRLEILDKILSQSESVLPAIMVDGELKKMGAKEEDQEKLRPVAEKRVRYELILRKIGQLEKLTVDQNELERESQKILENYKGADPERVGLYAEGLLMNEKVLQFLENQK